MASPSLAAVRLRERSMLAARVESEAARARVPEKTVKVDGRVLRIRDPTVTNLQRRKIDTSTPKLAERIKAGVSGEGRLIGRSVGYAAAATVIAGGAVAAGFGLTKLGDGAKDLGLLPRTSAEQAQQYANAAKTAADAAQVATKNNPNALFSFLQQPTGATSRTPPLLDSLTGFLWVGGAVLLAYVVGKKGKVF